MYLVLQLTQQNIHCTGAKNFFYKFGLYYKLVYETYVYSHIWKRKMKSYQPGKAWTSLPK